MEFHGQKVNLQNRNTSDEAFDAMQWMQEIQGNNNSCYNKRLHLG